MKAFAAAGLALTFAGCGGEGNQTEALIDRQPVEISSGTSFGMCAGYCLTELRIDSSSLTLIEESWQSELPTRTTTLPLDRGQWNRLQELVDMATIRSLEGVHGCPDCADGGAEWIQIEGIDSVRVTFEYGAALSGIEQLLDEIRALRARFERP